MTENLTVLMAVMKICAVQELILTVPKLVIQMFVGYDFYFSLFTRNLASAVQIYLIFAIKNVLF